MPIDDATWQQVRIAYCTSDLTTDAICKKFGIKSATLYNRRRKEDWPLRGQNWTPPKIPLEQDLQAASSQPSTPRPKAPPPTARAARASLILRLYHAIDLKLTQMEKRMAQDNETSSADHERETRALTGLIRNFERVTELNSDLTSPTRSARTASPASTSAIDASGGTALTTAATLAAINPASAEQLRRDIAQRLERILGKGNPPGNTG